ncbi:MAG: NADH-quinone oxidoreductase subunit J [Gemmatimonadales bacterium]
MTEFVFYTLAIFAVVSAILCISQKSPVASALWLVSTMFALAGIYVLLNAQFIAAMQVLVYAGAVMVLFLFVIMLLNLSHQQSDIRRGLPVVIGVLTGAGFVSALLTLSGTSVAGLAARLAPGVPAGSPLDLLPGGQLQTAAAASNVVGAVAEPMFRTYLVPFEITSVLLLAAAVGAVVLAKRKL